MRYRADGRRKFDPKEAMAEAFAHYQNSSQEAAAAAIHLGPVAWEAGCQADAALDAVAAAASAFSNLTAVEAEEDAVDIQSSICRSMEAANAATEAVEAIASIEALFESLHSSEDMMSIGATAEEALTGIALIDLSFTESDDVSIDEGAAQGAAADCEAAVAGLEAAFDYFHEPYEKQETAAGLGDYANAAVAACQLELVDVDAENEERHDAVKRAAAAVAGMDAALVAAQEMIDAATAAVPAEVACNAFKGKQQAEIYTEEEVERRTHETLAESLQLVTEEIVEYQATGADPRVLSNSLATNLTVRDFGKEAKAAIELEEVLQVDYFEAGVTAVEAMTMKVQSEEDVVAERAAAEQTEARARAVAAIKAATHAHAIVQEEAQRTQMAQLERLEEMADEERILDDEVASRRLSHLGDAPAPVWEPTYSAPSSYLPAAQPAETGMAATGMAATGMAAALPPSPPLPSRNLGGGAIEEQVMLTSGEQAMLSSAALAHARAQQQRYSGVAYSYEATEQQAMGRVGHPSSSSSSLSSSGAPTAATAYRRAGVDAHGAELGTPLPFPALMTPALTSALTSAGRDEGTAGTAGAAAGVDAPWADDDSGALARARAQEAVARAMRMQYLPPSAAAMGAGGVHIPSYPLTSADEIERDHNATVYESPLLGAAVAGAAGERLAGELSHGSRGK